MVPFATSARFLWTAGRRWMLTSLVHEKQSHSPPIWHRLAGWLAALRRRGVQSGFAQKAGGKPAGGNFQTARDG